MERIFKSAFFVIAILAVPSIVVMGQDKKSEQKVKIIINDGSGNKVVMDTIFKDTPAPDSIIVKDGTIIYLKHSDDGPGFKHHGREHFNVTYSSKGKGEGKEYKEMTIISADSLNVIDSGDSNKVYFYVDSGHKERGERDNVRYRVTRDRNDEGDNDSGSDKTRYVIAKDGMVVTIEGNDEAKTKELAKEIREKLGVTKEDNAKTETIKSESKTTIKK
jgi:hypothetical protein